MLLHACTKTTITTTDKNGNVVTTTTTGSGSTNNNSSGASSLSYQLDGVPKASTTVFAAHYTSIAAIGNTFSIQGQAGTGVDGIGLSGNYAKVGTYDVVNNNLILTYTSISEGITIQAESGTLVITSFTGSTISGTFQFNASGLNASSTVIKKVITNGKFNATYIKL